MQERKLKEEKTAIGYRPDGRWQNIVVEVKSNTHGFRNLRAALFGMAYWLVKEPETHGLLVLVDSRITEESLKREIKLAAEILHPGIMDRVSIANFKEGQFRGLPRNLGQDFHHWLEQLVHKETHGGRTRDSFYVVLQILLHQWLMGKGPMTTDWLMKTAGCSYPTVAGALGKLDHCLSRHSDRRVELRFFPKEEWARLLAISSQVRNTVRFVDASGIPRSPDAHLRRLAKMNIPGLAIGGVLGARHYHPSLDLTGSPLLDLSLHTPGREMDLEFIGKLDPALKPVENPFSPFQVAVHAVRRVDPFYQPREAGLAWAAPLECLLDLHEARLEGQALEFLQTLSSMKGRAI